MKRGNRPLFVVLLLGFAASALEGQEKFLSRFSLEFSGGLVSVNPQDLNEQASYEDAYAKYLVESYRRSYGGGYAVTSERIGDPRSYPLRLMNSAEVKVRFALTETVSFSLGFQYLRGARRSNFDQRIQIDYNRLDSVDYPYSWTYSYGNQGLRLAASAGILSAGVHLGFPLGRRLRAEGLFAVGPLWGRCEDSIERHTRTESTTIWDRDYVYDREIKGTGTGLSLEAGGRLRLAVSGFLDVFLEGSYARRRIGSVTGEGTLRISTKDQNAAQNPYVGNWEGKWKITIYRANTSWGTYFFRDPWNGDAANYEAFRLDLSGYQLKAGLIVRL